MDISSSRGDAAALETRRAMSYAGNQAFEQGCAAQCAFLLTKPLSEICAYTRDILAPVTNRSKNDGDALGDGDQSYVSALLPGPGTEAFKAWFAPPELAVLASSRFSEEAKIALVSSFGLACFRGDVATVRATFEASGLMDQAELLRRRHTAWRLTPLALCIAGSRFVNVPAAGGSVD